MENTTDYHLSELQTSQLRDAVAQLAGELAWELAGPPPGGRDLTGATARGSYSCSSDVGDADATRRARLAVLAALRHMAAAVDACAAEAARGAAEAGADYSDLAAAGGRASRQLARHTWPGLAPVTKAAREAERALRGAPRWALRYHEVWRLDRDGEPYGENDGPDPECSADAARWASEQVEAAGWRVKDWTEPDVDGVRTARLAGPASLPRPQDIAAGKQR